MTDSRHYVPRFAALLVFSAFYLIYPACSHFVGAAVFNGQVLQFEEREIYHSPETPGYTSWVGLWQLPDGDIQSNFSQIAGGVSSAPVIESTDGAKTWSLAPDYVPSGTCRGMAVLDDGTMVRPRWNSDLNGIGYVDRSTDGGRTWSDPIYFLPAEQYRAWPTLIKPLSDGRLVLMSGIWERDPTAEWPNPNIVKTMFLSSDGGQTWGNPITLMTIEEGACEESDFVELPNGDLMWIHRAEQFSPDGAYETSYLGATRMQSISQKSGDTFVSLPPQTLPWPHSGFPCTLMTQEGIILDLCTTGSHWSDDNGATWHNLLLGGGTLQTHYYPRALQTADGKIVVVAHRGGDDIPGTVDQAIILQTFRLFPKFLPTGGVYEHLGREIYSEDFEAAPAGTPVNALPGYAGSGDFVISATLVDAGQSAVYSSSTDWPGVGKIFSYEPGIEDRYIFSGTLQASNTSGDYAHVELKDSSVEGPGGRLHVALGYNELIFGYLYEDVTYSPDVRIPQLSMPMDFMVVLEGDSFDAYWRRNGDVEWSYAGHVDGGIPMSNFDQVGFFGHGGYSGAFDSIRLAVLFEKSPGDANLDGRVDGEDAALLASNWLTMSDATWYMGDFDMNGTVDDKDAAILAANFGRQQVSLPTASVPEPTAVVLLFSIGFIAAAIGTKNVRSPRQFPDTSKQTILDNMQGNQQ